MAEESWAGISYADLAKPKADLAKPQKDFLTSVIQDSDRNFFLKGCAGSGKTVVAAHAIRILRKEQNKSVKLLVQTNLLSKLINNDLRDIGGEIGDVECFHSWRPYLNDYYDIIVVTGVEDLKIEWIKKIKTFSNNQIWISDNLTFDSSEFSDCIVFELTTNYRNSISIAQLSKCFININEFDHREGITLQQKINDFIIPITKNERQKGVRNQPNIFIEAKNESDEFDAIAKIIKDIQNGNEQWKTIAIAQLKHDHLIRIDLELRNRGIDFLRIPKNKDIAELPNFDHRNLTILSPIHSLKGLEFDYIIFPRTETYKIGFGSEKEINDNLMFVLFSSAKTRVYCSYVDKNQSYVYNAIKSDVNNDFFQFVKSSEILGDYVQ